MPTLLLYFIIVVVWGTTWHAVTLQLTTVPMVWSLIYRFAASTFVFICVCHLSAKPLLISYKHHVLCLAIGLCIFSNNFLLIYKGTSLMPSGLVAIIYSTLPIFSAIVGYLANRSTLELRTFVASAVGMVGLTLIFLPELSMINDTKVVFTGIALTSFAVLLTAFATIISGSDRAKELSVLTMTTWACGYGTVFLLLVSILKGIAPSWDSSLSYVGSLLYLIVAGTIVGFLCFLTLIRRIGAARTAYAMVSFPVIALMISSVFEGYVWTLMSIVGVVLVGFGNFLILGRNKDEEAVLTDQ